jgi:UDP-glucose:(heptosyl)LPS alpha-1,3-glucosyltransferase
MRQELGADPSDTLLLFIGSGFKTKGLNRALISLSHLPPTLQENAHLVVIGQDQAGPYRRLAQKLKIADKVRFLGGRTDIPELLAAGDLLIHPAYMENTGTILLEAIASGLPVIATDVCGYADHIIKANAGEVLPSPFDQAQLDEQLAAALISSRKTSWSTNGIRYGANPELYHMPASAVDAIEGLVNNRRELNSSNDVSLVNEPIDPWVYLRPDLAKLGDFPRIMQLEGEGFREAPGRKTVRFSRHNQRYFLKTHTGVGWQEIIKNLVYFRLPVLGAMNEWHGAHHLQRLGIDTLSIAGYGSASGNPARRQSFIITDEITHAQSLEEFCGTWQQQPPYRAGDVRFKRWLIQRLAETARRLHNSGANHRDFYLCHFLLQPGYENGQLAGSASQLFVIDLHRMQLRRHTPKRWKIKDVAGLHYSSMDLGLTQRDRLRFMKIYTQHSVRHILTHEAQFWRRVDRRAQRLYRAERLRQPMANAPVAQSLRSASTQP